MTYNPTYDTINLSVIIICAISCVITTLIPLLVSIVLIVRKKITIAPFCCGVGAFFISQIVLRIPLLTMISKLIPTYNEFSATILGSILIGGLTAGLFEETARLIGAKILLKRNQISFIDGISFGLGHALCEVIILVGISYICDFTMLIMINTQTFETFMSALSKTTMEQYLNYYTSLTVIDFVYGLVERCSAIMYHILATIIVFIGVKNKKYGYYILAIALHTIFNSLAVILNSYCGTLIAEIVLLALSLSGLLFTIKKLKTKL